MHESSISPLNDMLYRSNESLVFIFVAVVRARSATALTEPLSKLQSESGIFSGRDGEERENRDEACQHLLYV